MSGGFAARWEATFDEGLVHCVARIRERREDCLGPDNIGETNLNPDWE